MILAQRSPDCSFQFLLSMPIAFVILWRKMLTDYLYGVGLYVFDGILVPLCCKIELRKFLFIEKKQYNCKREN